MACLDCVKGYLRTDKTPTGTLQNVYGLQTYVAAPPSNTTAKGVVVIVPDAFGWTFVNNRLLADTYAKAGFRVYLPDFMVGVSVPLYFLSSMERLNSFSSLTDIVRKPFDLFWTMRGILPFLWYNMPSTSHPRVTRFLEQARTRASGEDRGLPIFIAGFCWGGKHAVMLTHQAEAHLIDAIFTGHPSALTMPQDIDNVRKPVSIAVGTDDSWLSDDQIVQVRSKLKSLETDVPGMQSEVITYEGAAHGFSVRIDTKNPKQVEQAQQAEKQATDWFDKIARAIR